MDKTLTMVQVAKKLMGRKQISVTGKLKKSTFLENELTETEIGKLEVHFALPHSCQINAISPDGKMQYYLHNQEAYNVLDKTAEKLNQEETYETLDEIEIGLQKEINDLILYAEEFDVETNGNLTTMSLKKDGLRSELVLVKAKRITREDPTLLLDMMEYKITFNDLFEVQSFYRYDLRKEKEKDVHYIKELKMNFSPLDENIDFSIPNWIKKDQ